MKKLGKLFFCLLAISLFCDQGLRADLVGPYGTSPYTFDVDSNGLLMDTGNYTYGTLSVSGAGDRMFWFPSKAAFRAGIVGGTQWDSANLGPMSQAFGYNTIASNYETAAFGDTTTASGVDAFTSGENTAASGDRSMAIGAYTEALGTYSLATGWQTIAYGSGSMAGGYNAQAWADYSSAFGFSLVNESYASFVVGIYNSGLGTSNTTYVATDPIFEVGNGTSSTAKSDALIILKNGSMTAQGPITVTNAGGDIPMFTGY